MKQELIRNLYTDAKNANIVNLLSSHSIYYLSLINCNFVKPFSDIKTYPTQDYSTYVGFLLTSVYTPEPYLKYRAGAVTKTIHLLFINFANQMANKEGVLYEFIEHYYNFYMDAEREGCFGMFYKPETETKLDYQKNTLHEDEQKSCYDILNLEREKCKDVISSQFTVEDYSKVLKVLSHLISFYYIDPKKRTGFDNNVFVGIFRKEMFSCKFPKSAEVLYILSHLINISSAASTVRKTTKTTKEVELDVKNKINESNNIINEDLDLEGLSI